MTRALDSNGLATTASTKTLMYRYERMMISGLQNLIWKSSETYSSVIGIASPSLRWQLCSVRCADLSPGCKSEYTGLDVDDRVLKRRRRLFIYV